ncbi:hypothetical protein Taro_051235 [Colocasia esculenta]|uniref:Prolyl 4-hydroxylase alpha subunit Fe(2+) 2OG dioxygenase domain-containing protein n=1 Tax=Colocasia esculenta TaxID=4460 RepID=A0A843XFF8_COLES|nr:hypothetical protein [Colocasia esculenta]
MVSRFQKQKALGLADAFLMRQVALTHSSSEHGEGLQILHYEGGQKYEPHFDFFVDELNTKKGGQWIATVIYLSDVVEGGETIFPKLNGGSLPCYEDLSACGSKGLAVKPEMGDAFLFWTMNLDATPDLSSLQSVLVA